MNPDSESKPSPASVLEACSRGDSVKLQGYFLALGIRPPHPFISYADSPPPSAPPSTEQMIEAAIKAKQPDALAVLLTTFDVQSMPGPLLDAALVYADVPTFAIILEHDRDLLNRDLGHGNIALARACFNSDPSLPLYLLREGADPNAGGWFALSTLGIALAQNQPVELIKGLVEAGIDPTEEVSRAQDEGQETKLEKLSAAGVKGATSTKTPSGFKRAVGALPGFFKKTDAGEQ